jgi:hypothetical protein
VVFFGQNNEHSLRIQALQRRTNSSSNKLLANKFLVEHREAKVNPAQAATVPLKLLAIAAAAYCVVQCSLTCDARSAHSN